jgi:hypothetical protein
VKELGLDYIGYNRFIGLPGAELYKFIQDKGLVKYNHNGILIPATFYLSADKVTEIYSKIAHPFSIRLLSFIPKRKWIRSRFPTFYSTLRRLVYPHLRN